jgi:tRNA (cytidine32/uridine32-2'-O)-methyltransferase
MAASAVSVLDEATVVDTLQEAIADCHVVFGTSARLRNMPVQLLPPEDCAHKVMEAGQQQIAIVFGREVSGLTNEELHLCHYHVHIPVNPEYTSLNLAAAVMVVCYELRKAALRQFDIAGEKTAIAPAGVQPEQEWDQEPATAEELERYLQHLEEVLIRLDFHKPQYKRPLMRRLRRLFQRIQPDKMEINILRGILTATDQVLDGKKPLPQWRENGE